MTPEAELIERLRAAGCVFAEDEARLLLEAPVSATERDAMVARRIAGEPLEHVLGWAEFAGLRIEVDPGVFVPRRRSEFLAERAAALLPARGTLVELCCGTGAIALAVAARIPGIEVHAADLDPAAVACARRNLSGIPGAVAEGDLFAALPAGLRGRIDVLVANAPYVPSEEVRLMPREARDFEARLALDGGADGLDVQRRIIAEAPAWLAARGALLIETSEHQASATADAMSAAGLHPRIRTDRDATVVEAFLIREMV